MNDPSRPHANSDVWESLYAGGAKVNRYPHDVVVSFVMRNFAAAPDRSRVRLLDYGCGGGGNTAFMAAEGFETHGMDGSVSAVAHALRTVEAVTGRAARIVAGDFAALPYPDAFFDAVVDRQSLGQNAADRLPGMVAEIARVLKPGGLYLGINFSAGHPQLRFGRALGGGDHGDFSAGVFRGIGFRHFFDEAEVRALFAGFEFRELKLLRSTNLLHPAGGSEEIVVVAARSH